MGENSKIQWTHHSWNPWIGCTKVGPPCDFCYAAELAARYRWVNWGSGEPRKRTSVANWRKPYQWDKKAAAAGVRQRVFCASLADWLDNEVDQSWRIDLAKVIEDTPNLDWLLLTKRIGNFRRYADFWPDGPPKHVWLGITCGDQKEYDRDWPKLSEISASVRFISYEPALGPLVPHPFNNRLPDWIICGGESGPNHRGMPLEWARSLRDDCKRYGIIYFFKQVSALNPKDEMIPADLVVRHFPLAV